MCIPCTRKKGIAGWNDHAEPSRNEAIFWHRLWVDNGRPSQGHIADIRRRTRYNYKRIVKSLKNNQNKIISDRMAQSLQSKHKRPFWQEVKRMNSKSVSAVNCMDSVNGSEQISNLFACNYKELYNSVSYKIKDMNQLVSKVDFEVVQCCNAQLCNCSHVINIADVSNSVLKLKNGKTDGTNNVMSDALINGCSSLFVHLSLLYSAILRHGVSPDNMLLSTLIPIPKSSKKCLNDSTNYRAIALGSVLSKLLDLIIMDQSNYVFHSSDSQFGFKPKHSTSQCTFVVEEIIEFYNNNGSPVFLAALDASRAFDRVEYCKLFELLIGRNMCPMFLRLLLYMYTHQKLRVKWNGFCSDSFNVTNGVKQGGILSPLLFCIYIDVLLERLRFSNVGCYIGNVYVGGVGYADDICLMAPSCRALRRMLSVCEVFGKEYHVKFNSLKSHVTVCSKHNNIAIKGNFTLNGEIIDVSNSILHLGRSIGDFDSDRKAIDKAIGELYMRTNYVMSKFGCCSSNVRNYLFRTYCTSYYGSPLWSLSQPYINRFYCAWRKCVRRIWKLPAQTHCAFVEHLYGDVNIDMQLLRRFASFYYCALESKNNIVALCAKMCEYSKSYVAYNRKHLLYRLNNNGSIFKGSLKEMLAHLSTVYSADNIIVNHASVIIELCNIRDGVMHLDSEITNQELNEFVSFLCTT